MTRSTVVPMALVRSCWVRASSPTNRQSRLPSSIFCFVSYPKVGPWSNSRYALSITSHHIASHHITSHITSYVHASPLSVGCATLQVGVHKQREAILSSVTRAAVVGEHWASDLRRAGTDVHWRAGRGVCYVQQPCERCPRGIPRVVRGTPGKPSQGVEPPEGKPRGAHQRRHSRSRLVAALLGVRLDNFHGQPKKLPGKQNMTTTRSPPPVE